MSRLRLVVLGSGIAGLSVAWEACRRGLEPTVVRGRRPRTSEAAAGMLAPMPESSGIPRLSLLAAEGLRHYPTFLSGLGPDAERRAGFIRSGVVRLAYGDGEAEALRDEVGTYEAAGMPSRWLGRGRCAEELPGLNPDGLTGALLSFDEAQVQPAWLLDLLEERILETGGRFIDGEALQVQGGGAEGAEIRLDDGTVLAAEKTVVAMGSWSSLLEGVECRVRPVRGQLLVATGLPLPARMLFVGHDYILGKADGSLVVGGTVEEGSGFWLEPGEASDRLSRLVAATWPAAAAAAFDVRVGLRPAAPDELPLVGPAPGLKSVSLFTGHHRNGFLLSPLAAALLVDELTGAPPQRLLAPFRPRRFAGESALG